MPPVKFTAMPGVSTVPNSMGLVSKYKPNPWNPGFLGTDLALWYRGDLNLTASAGRASAWAPALAGYGPTLLQATANNQPHVVNGSSSGVAASLTGLQNQKASAAEYLSGSLSGLGLSDASPLSIVVAMQRVVSGNIDYSASLQIGQRSGPGGLYIYSHSDGGANGGDNTPHFALGAPNGTGGGNSMQGHSTVPNADGTIMHLGLTLDGSGKIVGAKFYSNGSLLSVTTDVDTYTPGGSAASVFSSGNLIIGSGFDDPQDIIFELYIAKRVMTATEMANAYQYFQQQM